MCWGYSCYSNPLSTDFPTHPTFSCTVDSPWILHFAFNRMQYNIVNIKLYDIYLQICNIQTCLHNGWEMSFDIYRYKQYWNSILWNNIPAGGKTVFSKQTTADFYVSDHGVITENIKDPCSIVIPMKNNHLREGNGLTWMKRYFPDLQKNQIIGGHCLSRENCPFMEGSRA